jgi:hypothetical protein
MVAMLTREMAKENDILDAPWYPESSADEFVRLPSLITAEWRDEA